MAASMNWRQILNKHKVFQVLKKALDVIKADSESKNILTIFDGELFVWNAYNCSVLTTNLKLLVGKNESEVADVAFQTLLCNNAASFDVNSLLFSECGSYLAIVGKKGISVLELPQKWGKYAEFEGGKERILCRTTPLAERFFLSTKECLLQAAWHPGSENEMHIVLLLSDNTLRIYNLRNPQSAEQTYHLDGGGGVSTPRLRLQNVLGESAVSFDFGPPVELQVKKRAGMQSTESEHKSYMWPIYVLFGNGDVYVLNTTLSNKKADQSLIGPLTMFPPAEDNYGTDACFISCLYTRPPTIVIATSEGKLHHCVLLTDTDADDSQSVLSVSSDTDSTLYQAPATSQRLYVYETIELELSLTTLSLGAEGLQDEFSCPIRIHKDGICADRYHCSHSAGIHTVALPWQQKIQQFCDEDEGTSPPSLSESEHSIVEHLVCTKPLTSSPACPILGLCVTADRLLGPNLICLTNTYECVVLPLLTNYKTKPPPLLSDAPSKAPSSPMRKLHREEFDAHIKKILTKSSSNPLLKTSAKTDLTSQECLQLLSRATQVFREEYIQKQDLAREEIQKRIRIIKEHKELQLSDLQECQQSRNIMKEKAQTLAEKYEDAKDHQEQIVDRLETILKKIQSRLPVLTEAEKNMQRELTDIEEQLKVFKSKTQQLKAKLDYQRRQTGLDRSKKSTQSFSKTQAEQLRTVLKDEGDDIAGLVKQVNQLKVSLEV